VSRTIEIVIAPTGEATVQTTGFTGSSCRDASRFLEEALGRQTDERLTPEFHETAQTETQNRQRI